MAKKLITKGVKALFEKALDPKKKENKKEIARRLQENAAKKAAPKKPAAKKKKAKKLSPDKARQDLAVVGKKAQDMMTALRAKKDKLAKMLREGAAPDAIERQKAAIKDMEGKMGPVLKEQVKRRKVKPIPQKPKKKPATPAPRQKAPAEKRPIPAGLIAAAREAKTPTFMYKGKKYSKAVILKGEKKMAYGGMAKKKMAKGGYANCGASSPATQGSSKKLAKGGYASKK